MPEDTPLRIAIVIERFAPHAGGVEKVAWQVAHELVRQGEDVTVLTREAKDYGETAGLQICPISTPTAWQPIRVGLFSRRSAARIRHGGFDIVHGFARTRHQDLYRAGGGSHADYLRRNYSPLGQALRRFSPRHRTLLAIERGVFSDPNQRIQCASRLVADSLVNECRVDRERIFLLPNAVDSERYSKASAQNEGDQLRRNLGQGAQRIWLLPGSGWDRKGLAVLLSAARGINDPDLHFWIAGRDDPRPWRARIRDLGLTDRIRFIGERQDLPAVYQAVDGMILPTRYDPFANVTLEAAAAGLPIITSAANGAAEWLGDDLDVVEAAEDAAGFVQALERNREHERRAERGARLAVRAQRFNWPDHVKQLRAEYARILLRIPGRSLESKERTR